MAKLLGMLAAAAVALGGAPAVAGEYSGDHDGGQRYQDRPYVYFAPGDFGRSGRFVSWDDGYFAFGGGVEVRNNQALYDYDRDYPYEYRSHWAADEKEEPMELSSASCTIEQVRDRQTGETTEIRICRN